MAERIIRASSRPLGLNLACSIGEHRFSCVTMRGRPRNNLPQSRGMWPIVTDGVRRDQDLKSSWGGPCKKSAYDPREKKRILSRARNDSRAVCGPSPSILSLTGRGEDQIRDSSPSAALSASAGGSDLSPRRSEWHQSMAGTAARPLDKKCVTESWIARCIRTLVFILVLTGRGDRKRRDRTFAPRDWSSTLALLRCWRRE